jgi:antirestriction protein ArdC
VNRRTEYAQKETRSRLAGEDGQKNPQVQTIPPRTGEQTGQPNCSVVAGCPNPLPQIGSVNGDPGKHRERLEQFVRDQGIALEYSADIAPAKGLSEGGKIKLLPGQSPAETVATLVHELAHERLHRAERRASTTKRLRETEAEAVAFVVCQAIGLETGTASADYISLWNGDTAVLLESLEVVQRTATEIIAAITADKPLPPEG